MYKPILCLKELQNYLAAASAVAFDFETAPDEKYRNEDKAVLDAHKSHIILKMGFTICKSIRLRPMTRTFLAPIRGYLVGVGRFELPTSRSRTVRATILRYTPTNMRYVIIPLPYNSFNNYFAKIL